MQLNLYWSIKKQHSYTTHMQVFQVTSFGSVNKPSADLFLYQQLSSVNLHLHVGLRCPSLEVS